VNFFRRRENPFKNCPQGPLWLSGRVIKNNTKTGDPGFGPQQSFIFTKMIKFDHTALQKKKLHHAPPSKSVTAKSDTTAKGPTSQSTPPTPPSSVTSTATKAVRIAAPAKDVADKPLAVGQGGVLNRGLLSYIWS
jgi:hypothetical protein